MQAITTLTLSSRYAPDYIDSEIVDIPEGHVCVDVMYSIPSTYFMMKWHGLNSPFVEGCNNLAAISVGVVTQSKCATLSPSTIVTVSNTNIATVIIAPENDCVVLDDFPLPAELMRGYALGCMVAIESVYSMLDNPSILVIGRTPLADLFTAATMRVLDVDCDQFTGGSTKFTPETFGFYDGIIDCRYAPSYDSCRCCINTTGFYYPVNMGTRKTKSSSVVTEYGHNILTVVPTLPLIEAAALAEYDSAFNIPATYCNFRNLFPAMSSGLFCSIHMHGD